MLSDRPEVGMSVTFDVGLPTEGTGRILSVGMDNVLLRADNGDPIYIAIARLDPSTFLTTNR